ncbi:hypothetical protein AB0L39_07565 [Streptomyces parvus]|uniref:hypothetical protein n=1 Tax=Streptomyces parvus TaxID=66428 RepID=UPI003432D0AC
MPLSPESAFFPSVTRPPTVPAVGNLPVIAGPAGERARHAHASATAVVDGLNALRATPRSAGATVTTPETAGPTGRFRYARHAGGAEIGYVEWTPGLVRRVIRP